MHGSEVHIAEKLEWKPDKLTGEDDSPEVIIFLVVVSGVTPCQFIVKDLRFFCSMWWSAEMLPSFDFGHSCTLLHTTVVANWMLCWLWWRHSEHRMCICCNIHGKKTAELQTGKRRKVSRGRVELWRSEKQSTGKSSGENREICEDLWVKCV